MRQLFTVIVLSFFAFPLFAQVQSPETFLGYKPGTRFTPHYQLVNYFRYVAQQVPSMMKIEEYGLTNEGRPLLLSYIASPSNLQNLEGIRKNNLELANVVGDQAAVTGNTPAIVWLSYNVHGNEASSSEAAMLTLYALIDPLNRNTKEWLKNLVVIIDPCLNPDGRDRYTNWFTTLAGKEYNPDPQSREHREPWPGGRTNHYNFDLNRDWAWQTQVESQQRMKKYNAWLPQVHVDFHEMSYNNPYFFAPAAEPYHEVITPWQKEFQTMIGRNNAKYFDQNGWLYFTKGGGYDLFYPSYGDTYPTYHGAIGMTFEQGGGGSGGLGVITEDGDTLTLEDRVTHHFTTGLSTLEIASQNSLRLLKEFRKFYKDAMTKGAGEFKSYVIKRSTTSEDMEGTLYRYLANNGITWGYAQANSNVKALNYISGKDEGITVEKGDVVISALQPQSVMLQVLFEPKSRLSEVTSTPYDITAWSLPYALGLEAYGVKDKYISTVPATGGGNWQSAVTGDKQRDAYAYVIPWKNLSAAKVLSRLLLAGIKVRVHEQPFAVNGKSFDAGTLVVTKASNVKFGKNLYDTLLAAAYKSGDFHYDVEPVYSGFVDKGSDLGSNKVRVIKTPKVALLSGEGTDPNALGALWHFFEREIRYPVTLVNANDMERINLTYYDVVIMPNSTIYRFLNDRLSNERLRLWVQNGGKLIAMEGAVEQLADGGWGLKNKAEADKKARDTNDIPDPYLPVKKYANRVREDLASVNSGTIFKVQLDNTHPLGYGYPEYYFTLKQDDAVYEFIKEGGWNVGVLKKGNYISGFLGSKVQDKLNDGLIFGVQEVGKGSVVYMADDVIFRSFWENGKLLLCNAVFMVGQ